MTAAHNIPMLELDIGKMLRILDKLSVTFQEQESRQLDIIHQFRQTERDYERHVLHGAAPLDFEDMDRFKGLPLESYSEKVDGLENSTEESIIKPPDSALLLTAQQLRSDALTALDTLESCKEILKSLPSKIPTVVGLRALIHEVDSQVEILESEPNARHVEYLETYLLQLDGFLYGIGLTSKI